MDVQPISFMVTMREDNYTELPILIQLTPYMRGLTSPAKIRRKNTFRVWEVVVVGYERSDRRQLVKFSGGWEECRAENEADEGDDVVFEYSGNSVFTMYVLSGEDGRAKAVDPGTPPTITVQIGQRPRASGFRESVILSDCFITNSRYPAFKVMLTPSYMQTGVLNIPFNFALDHLPNETQTEAIVKVKGCTRHVTLSMYYRKGRPYNCKFSAEMKGVIDESNLLEGQILAFELTNMDPIKFHVTIFGP